MRNLSLLTKLFLTAMLGLGLALFGCPPDTSDDDDDVSDDDVSDDDIGDDDIGDDDTGDDDTGDDDTGDDDTGGPGTYYLHEQDLTGTPSNNPCPGCEFTFDITYATTDQYGSCMWCWDLADGQHTLGYDADYYYGSYGPYEAVFLDYSGSWSFWYSAYAGYGGHDVVFFFYTYYYNYVFYQYGYWDISGGAMTGFAGTYEMTM